MNSSPCHRCGRWWSHNAGPGFSVITRFCPNCIPLMLPLMGVVAMPRRSA